MNGRERGDADDTRRVKKMDASGTGRDRQGRLGIVEHWRVTRRCDKGHWIQIFRIKNIKIKVHNSSFQNCVESHNSPWR